jgi:1-acyl-sn-glycerol-3-phosphate acyltransferase
MKRILLMVFRNLWFVPWAWCKLCYRASHTDKYTEEEQYSFIRWVDLHANKGGNVKIDVHGSENIPAENGFMFFPNHQGLYDVLAMIEVHVLKMEIKSVHLKVEVLKLQQRQNARSFRWH